MDYSVMDGALGTTLQQGQRFGCQRVLDWFILRSQEEVFNFRDVANSLIVIVGVCDADYHGEYRSLVSLDW